MQRQLRNIAWATIVFALGCGSDTSSLTLDDKALDSPNGAVSTTDEAPAFGDPILAAEGSADASQGNVAADEDATVEATGARVYYLAAAWGQLRWARHPLLPARADDARPMPTTWDGTLCAGSAGVGVRLLRAVRFEGRSDRIVRRGPACIEWKSATLPRWDGILARVVVSANVSSDANALVFTTAAASATLRVGELAGLHRVTDVGNDRGDQVAMVAVPRPPCGGGFLQGRWMRLSARGGFLFARFENHLGELGGHLRGIWGTTRDGTKVLFGKVVGLDGRFLGRFVGTYGEGRFRAVYAGRDGEHRGVLFGRYVGDDDRGFFRGVHIAACTPSASACQCETAPPSASSSDIAAPCSCGSPR